MMKETTLVPNEIYLGDAFNLLRKVKSESVDLVLTDPPYFLNKLDKNLDPQKIKSITRNQQIDHLPAGMKFDPEQGRNLQRWYGEVSKEIFRVLKPGGFFLSFSSPRLVHRMAIAVEDSGFWIRDIFICFQLHLGSKKKVDHSDRNICVV